MDRCVRRLGSAERELALAVAILGVALPVALLPDGSLKPWKTVDPVTYPAGFDQVEAALVAEGPGDVATLPWRAYRRFDWGHGLTSSDPALRWYDRAVLTSDDLQVGATLVRGESQRARSIGRSLGHESPAEALRGADVGYALVYVKDPDYGHLDLAGLEPVYADADLALYRVPGVTSPSEPPAWRRVVVVSVDLLVAALVLFGAGVGAARRRPGAALDRLIQCARSGGESIYMLLFVKLLAPVIAGGIAAGVVTFGFVHVQTAPPDVNPAGADVITYGDQ